MLLACSKFLEGNVQRQALGHNGTGKVYPLVTLHHDFGSGIVILADVFKQFNVATPAEVKPPVQGRFDMYTIRKKILRLHSTGCRCRFTWRSRLVRDGFMEKRC